MKYCKKCVNPENVYEMNDFDENGVCGMCRNWKNYDEVFAAEQKNKEKRFIEILERYRSKDGSNYDMIIPVSGGKDSLYQVHLLKKVYGFNPLLVTFNHTFNTKTGIYNMTNMVEKLGVDHIRFTPNPQLISKTSRLSLKKFGDICWHCHCGIFTFPLRIAVAFKIPLLISEHKYYGLLSADEENKFQPNLKDRLFAVRAEAKDMVDKELGIELKDLVQWQMPSQEEIDKVGVRGLSIAEYIKWDSKVITEFLIKEYGFKTKEHDRTYDCYANAECHHCSGTHDYLRYLKSGYGRVTDDVGIDIRKGLMTREEGIKMVEKFDGVKPKDLEIYLKRVNMTEEEFMKYMEDKREESVWFKDSDGQWQIKDSVSRHKNDQGVEKVISPLSRVDSYKRISNPLDDEIEKHIIM